MRSAEYNHVSESHTPQFGRPIVRALIITHAASTEDVPNASMLCRGDCGRIIPGFALGAAPADHWSIYTRTLSVDTVSDLCFSSPIISNEVYTA